MSAAIWRRFASHCNPGKTRACPTVNKAEPEKKDKADTARVKVYTIRRTPCRTEGNEAPVFSWDTDISKAGSVGELEMPWGWLGFRQRKRPLVTSCIYMYNMQRPCVTSVTVSPYNLPSNQIRCPGVCFHKYFPRRQSQGKYLWKAKPEHPWQQGFDLPLIIGETVLFPIGLFYTCRLSERVPINNFYHRLKDVLELSFICKYSGVLCKRGPDQLWSSCFFQADAYWISGEHTFRQ